VGLVTRRVQVARREVELEYSRAQTKLAKPSVQLQGHGVIITRRDGHHAAQAGGHGALASHIAIEIRITSPRHHGAIRLQGHGVRTAQRQPSLEHSMRILRGPDIDLRRVNG